MKKVSLSARLENVFVSYVCYLEKIFWPSNLSPFYPLPEHWPVAVVALSIFLVTGISIGVVVARASRPFLLVGWLWYLGTLVPMIGLVQVGSQSMADRYTYISGIGALVMVGGVCRR